MRVLLVEDNAADARLVHEMLKETHPRLFHVSRVETLREALRCLARGSYDVVLLDLGLPDAYGPQAVVRVLEAAPGVPVVVLSGLQEEHLSLQAVQLGAQEYLMKGREDAEQLVRSIRYAIARERRTGRARTPARPSGHADLARA